MKTPGAISLREGVLETAWWGDPARDAPTLVLLHEGLGCVELWRDVPELLAEKTGCSVFAYSRFGYGRSDPTPLPRPLDYMQIEATEILPRVLHEANIRQAILLGHSDGGSIAAVYAGAHPDSPILVGLVTISAHFFVEPVNIRSIEQIRREYETTDLRSRLARYHDDVDVAFYGWNGAWLEPGFRSFDITGFLPDITVPVLGLQGEQDPYGTDEQLRVMAAMVKSPIRTALIPHARHSPLLEAKDTTLTAIAEFIAELPGGPWA
jgi:pimeloyl-ACP methyl ester carboxylesterase